MPSPPAAQLSFPSRLQDELISSSICGIASPSGGRRTEKCRQSAPIMEPAPGERLLRFVGDRIRFTSAPRPGAWLARAAADQSRPRRRAPARNYRRTRRRAGSPMPHGGTCRCKKTPASGKLNCRSLKRATSRPRPICLTKNWQHWPDGPDVGIPVHPDFARTANTIYCAFTRLFGPTKICRPPRDENGGADQGARRGEFCRLPPSGTFRDLTRQLPFIVHRSAAASSICCRSIPRPPPMRASAGSAALMPRWI